MSVLTQVLLLMREVERAPDSDYRDGYLVALQEVVEIIEEEEGIIIEPD